MKSQLHYFVQENFMTVDESHAALILAQRLWLIILGEYDAFVTFECKFAVKEQNASPSWSI